MLSYSDALEVNNLFVIDFTALHELSLLCVATTSENNTNRYTVQCNPLI